MAETPQETLERLAKKYQPLFNETSRFYRELRAGNQPTTGHDWDHDLFVAQYCILITPATRTGELAWIAALLHSIDRHNPTRATEVTKSRLALIEDTLAPGECETILDAALKHNRLNDASDSDVLITLKDADRLANVGSMNLFRGGQHRPNIPACILGSMGTLNPASTFQRPTSCYDALYYNLEWELMLRLPKAQELGRPYFDFFRQFQALALHQQKQVGLHPYVELATE